MALIESIEYEAVLHGVASFAIKKYNVAKEKGVEKFRSKPTTRAVNPGDDISMYPEEIQEVCDDYWTEDVITAFNLTQDQS